MRVGAAVVVLIWSGLCCRSGAGEHSTDQGLVDWVRQHGGFFSPKLEVRDGTRGRGVFAAQPVHQGEPLMRIPSQLILQGADASPCSVVTALSKELQRGECSRFWPYLASLRGVEVDIPNAWGMEELALLDGLPPGDWRMFGDRLSMECGQQGTLEDPFVLRAVMLYTSRAGPTGGMMPIFDLFNHGWNSTSGTSMEDYVDRGEYTISARRAHSVGEEFLNEFKQGAGNGAAAYQEMHRKGSQISGAPELFREFGFVELPPVQWGFRLSLIHI